ncbi:MAG: hypothetical protein AAF357_10435 [Verrucomicrobiota bacterium]
MDGISEVLRVVFLVLLVGNTVTATVFICLRWGVRRRKGGAIEGKGRHASLPRMNPSESS